MGSATVWLKRSKRGSDSTHSSEFSDIFRRNGPETFLYTCYESIVGFGAEFDRGIHVAGTVTEGAMVLCVFP